MLKAILVFALCSFLNVVLVTIKTIIMYRNEKISSAIANAVCYGFYTIVVVLMAGDLPLFWKVGLTAITNFFGVWISMLILERLRKDKLWKIEVTIPTQYADEVETEIANIPHSKLEINGKYNLYYFYCATHNQSLEVKKIITKYEAKYFVSESKSL